MKILTDEQIEKYCIYTATGYCYWMSHDDLVKMLQAQAILTEDDDRPDSGEITFPYTQIG